YHLDVTNGCDNASSTADASAADVTDLPGPVGGTLRLSQDRRAPTLSFHWTDVPAASGYVVAQDTVPSGTFTSQAGTAPDGPTGLTIATPAGPRWYFLVAGVSSCGTGPLSP